MKCLFVADRKVSSAAVELLSDALENRGLEVIHVDPGFINVRLTVSDGTLQVQPESTPGTIIVHRNIMESAPLLEIASKIWKESGALIINDLHNSLRARNKFKAAIVLARAGIPVLETVAFRASTNESLPKFSIDSVIKPACGARGVGVVRLRPEDSWVEPVEVMPPSYRPFWLLQREVVTHGEDFRAFVVGGKCIALMRREAQGDEWRANVSLGAKCQPLDPSGPIGELAVSAVQALGLVYASVDLLEVDGASVINEVDPWGGFSAISATTGVDVAQVIADYITQLV
jgi:ribosomal protein S6--L-glutamate ligase